MIARAGRSLEGAAGQGIEPASERQVLSSSEEVASCQLDEVSGPGDVVGSERVVDRCRVVALLLEPCARPPMKGRDQLWLLGQQSGPQQIGEQVVVAVPAPAIIERDDEQVRALERLERVATVIDLGDGVAQGPRQSIEDRGLEEETLDPLFLTIQDLLDEVVDDVPVVPGELRDERARVGSPADRQGRELQGRDPAFGPSLEDRDVARRQPQAHRAVEVRLGFVFGEPQIRGADLDQVPARAKSSQGEGRICARDENHMELWRRVVEEELEPLVDLGAFDDVVVVDHEQRRVRDLGKGVQKRREDRFNRNGVRVEQRARHVADRRRPFKRGGHVGPERAHLVVSWIQRHPGGRPSMACGGCEPLRDDRGLAEARRRRNNRQLGPRAALEEFGEARPRHDAWTWLGSVELGLKQLAGHGPILRPWRRVRQCRTVPAASPRRKLLRSTRKSTSGGTITIAIPANASPWSVA